MTQESIHTRKEYTDIIMDAIDDIRKIRREGGDWRGSVANLHDMMIPYYNNTYKEKYSELLDKIEKIKGIEKKRNIYGKVPITDDYDFYIKLYRALLELAKEVGFIPVGTIEGVITDDDTNEAESKGTEKKE